jgi:hypothetical protein
MKSWLLVSAGPFVRPLPIINLARRPDPKMHLRVVEWNTALQDRFDPSFRTLGFVSEIWGGTIFY